MHFTVSKLWSVRQWINAADVIETISTTTLIIDNSSYKISQLSLFIFFCKITALETRSSPVITKLSNFKFKSNNRSHIKWLPVIASTFLENEFLFVILNIMANCALSPPISWQPGFVIKKHLRVRRLTANLSSETFTSNRKFHAAHGVFVLTTLQRGMRTWRARNWRLNELSDVDEHRKYRAACTCRHAHKHDNRLTTQSRIADFAPGHTIVRGTNNRKSTG